MGEIRIEIQSYRYLVVSVQFVEKSFLSPMNCFDASISEGAFLYSFPFLFFVDFLPTPKYFDYCVFILSIMI